MRTVDDVTAPSSARRRRLPRPEVVAVGVLAAAVVAAVVLHLWAGDRFPTPWLDEAHFLLPAARLAETGSLAVPELNAPEGIYWLPDGYYVVLAAAYLVLPDTIEVARGVSLLLVVTAAGGFFLAARRLDLPPVAAAVVIAAWLVSTHVVVAGNVARMEALVLAAAGLSLACVASQGWVMAVALAVLAPLVHPAGLAVTGAVLAAASVGRGNLRPRFAVEWVVAAAALAGLAAEVVHVAGHWDVATDHIAFQLRRKRIFPLAYRPDRILLAPFAAAGLGVVLARRRGLGARAPLRVALLTLALGFLVVGAAGHEMWYGVYSGPTAIALLTLAALDGVARSRATARGRAERAALTAVSLLFVLGVVGAVARVWKVPATEGLSPRDASRGAWALFVTDAVSTLERLDARLDRTSVVAVHPLSALTPVLAEHRWEHLRFVQPTQVTPTDGALDAFGRHIDYWLATPGRRHAAIERYTPRPPPWAWAPVITSGWAGDDYVMLIWRTPDPPPPNVAAGWAS